MSHSGEVARREVMRSASLTFDGSTEVVSEPVFDATPAALGDDDASLVTRARAGDRAASQALYRRHAPDVFRVATFLLGRSADVDDVVQDAFVKAFDKLDGLREPSVFGGWVTRIAANLARSRLRRRGLFRRLGLDRGQDEVSFDRFASDELGPEERADLSRLAAVIAALPADERVAWTLRRVEGWALAEIAESLGMSLATVKRKVGAAEQALAKFSKGGRR